MKKVIQKIRIAAIVIGCSIILFGIFFNCFSFVNQLKNQSEFQPFYFTLILGTIYGFVASFFQGTIIILLALIIDPNKVAPLLDKKEKTSVKEEIIDKRDE
jgi:uncharacterized membrane protein HdeD (DUF308 family)